jgi:flagellar hook-basal body complex protein FliE
MAVVNDAGSVLAQIRNYQARIAESRNDIAVPARLPNEVAGAPRADFGGMVGQAFLNSMRQVNHLQSNANQLMTRFESGEDVPLTDVVLSMQKASLAFEATLQVRNKVLKAYEDIMNMPV